MAKTIVIAAGGTGGHIFPGLAVAEKLIANGCHVVWIGTIQGLEATLISKHNIDIYYIKITGIRGKNWITKILAPFNILFAIFQSIKILYTLNPYTVLGMGGFVTGPVGVAAWLLRKRLIIHEQNAIAGSSNRILAYFANHILESFPNSFPARNWHKNKITLSGNPVRQNLLGTSLSENVVVTQEHMLRVLVLGGSRGAKFLNQIVPEALGELPNVKILHQTGEQDFAATCELYNKKNMKNIHEIKPFIDNMRDAYLSSDLVICRAGASTIFEIMAIGIASILIPLPWSIDDHQTKNALYLANNNAGVLIKQSEVTIEKLQELVVKLIADSNKLYSIKTAARSLYKQYELNNSADYIGVIINN